ncbi:PfkB family carbohydrate kinase [Streptomyces sp. NPDC049813]|uniref:PfkB family carbohydrate kinase n=1 Tax=Streptomyces sp. NPDC049813 TaxID=3365597 RepID=UPI0037978C8F
MKRGVDEKSSLSGARVVVCGALAFDEILQVEGTLWPTDDHPASVRRSFVAVKAHTAFGGCAGTIGYALAGLGHTPILVASIGRDAGAYTRHLRNQSVDLSAVMEHPDLLTARCVVLTDVAGAQLIAFHPGAVARHAPVPTSAAGASLAMLAPSTTTSVIRQMQSLKHQGIPVLWLPSHSVADYRNEQLRQLLGAADYVIVNETEDRTVRASLQASADEVSGLLSAYIVTLGDRGSVLRADGRVQHIAPVPATVQDPTGSGDFYAAGFAHGVLSGLDLVTAAMYGSVMGSLNAAHKGTQTFPVRPAEIAARFAAAYNG